jgi:hypothetical protein
MWGRLIAEVFSLPGVVEGHSQVSPPATRAVFFAGVEATGEPERSLYPDGRLEPVHLHGVDDTSIHLTLTPERGAELIDLGWARPHQYAEFGTEFLIFGPRDAHEVAIVLAIVKESLEYARAQDFR